MFFFFNFMINSESITFWNLISDQQLQNGHFQQDSATAPTSHAIMEYQQQFFDNQKSNYKEKNLTQQIMKPYPIRFFLWAPENKVLRRVLHTAEEFCLSKILNSWIVVVGFCK
jgi:hypothetical protein